MSYLVLFRSCVSSVLLALRLPRLGKRELILVPFVRLFDFALVWFCLFPLPRDVWEGLRLVIMALPGLSVLLPFFVLNMRNYKFHSKYVIKQRPFTDGEQQTYRTGGEQTNRKDGKQQTPGRHRTSGEQQTQQSGGKQQTHRHQSYCFPPCQIQWCQLEWSVANGVAHPFRLY